MTDEAQGHRPEEAPTPPASTRWSEEPVQDDDALAPPFVPGRSSTSASHAASDEETAAAEPAVVEDGAVEADEAVPVDELLERQDALPGQEIGEETDGDADAFPFETESRESAGIGSGSDEDDFPFEQFDIEGGEAEDDMSWSPASLYGEEADEAGEFEGPGEAEVDEAAAGEEGEPAALAEAGPDGFPGEDEEADGLPGQEEEVDPWAAVPEAEASEWEGDPEDQEDPWQSEEEDPWQSEQTGAAEPVESTGAEREAGEATDAGAEQEVARLLDDMARMLREEGASAIRREMESDDRLTAVLAGLVAGYLTGRS